MSDAALLRPGVAVGLYPEREDIRDGFLDRVAAAAWGAIRQNVQTRRPRIKHFSRKIKAHDVILAAMSEEELSTAIHEIRMRLYSEGLKKDLVAHCFALIREVSGRHIGLRHYDVQLYGGWVMLQGKIAEMETGEGKTLTATLPAATAALAGIPVHVVTVNDFLVLRDAEWMGGIYRALGLSVATITEGMTTEQRRDAYACDVVYCTNKQLVFDYLKDRIVLGQENRPLHLRMEGLYSGKPKSQQLIMRGLCFAIVDEADSVMVDEARTPLIISAAGDNSQEEKTFKDAIAMARRLITPRDYRIRQRDRQIEVSELGKAQIARLSRYLGGVWAAAGHREELMRQALSALHLYELDKHYLIHEGQVQIVDEYTGRVMADRSWERGLHQMIEVKEGLQISGKQETLARISYQRFFRRYLRVGGMTGTAREVASELWSVYRLDVVTIPTNRPTRRRSFGNFVYPTQTAKWREIVEQVLAAHERGQPILIGTRSVAASEHLSELLSAKGLEHRVLNARQDQSEAEIIAQAGQPGRVTVATNMAGRGTDILLADGVAENGGLLVLASERHDARRVDRQLFGRAGRQGDAGSYMTITSLEDDLLQEYYGRRLEGMIKRGTGSGKRISPILAYPLVEIAQIAAERHHSRIRRDLFRADDSLGDMLAFSGRCE